MASYIYAISLRLAIVRLPLPRVGYSQGQEVFLTLSAVKQPTTMTQAAPEDCESAKL